MKKKREQVLLEPEQHKLLNEYSDNTGLAKTEIIRQALDLYFKHKNIDQ